ncbi:MAG TPA: CatB-related O-acetyltransferase [Pseudomonas xinjiangensis]|uniref:CatB-related O-acetyltransferase n=2 Tax=root TaxID=1 RepID=A0A7V1FSI0_9GAMM|nr:CatB-related O-acetyltransferase [Halopseudomonas xinjiangensis]HEC49498.1 CatB-related O-acetyltransferase [Halopseudomonas xinjiangensis]
MIRWRASFWKRWLRRRDLKLATSLKKFAPSQTLRIEPGVSIGNVGVGFKSLEIGAMTYIRSGSELINVQTIGRFCSIGSGVVIGQEASLHPLDWVSTHPFQYTATPLSYDSGKEPVIVGHDVWIGREALIFDGINIGTGAVIAARAVVTKDVPPYAIVAGIPARVVRFRHNPETIAGLLSSRWWTLPQGQLSVLPMNDPDSFLSAISDNPLDQVNYKVIEIDGRGCRTVSD